jgi:hypothetical protein
MRARRLLFAAVSGRVLGFYDQWRASPLKYFSKPPKKLFFDDCLLLFHLQFSPQLRPS